MFNYLQKKGVLIACLCLGLAPAIGWGQPCDGQEGALLDTPIPVSESSASNPEAHCFYFRFDSDITGWPTGITMDLWHEYEGDLGIFVEACGQRLNVLQRPGAVGNCDPDCAFNIPDGDCGSSAMIGTQPAPEIITFYDNGTEPDGGISAGGNFGLTADDACGVGTPGVNSFVDLWSNCPEGLVEAEICFTDHATLHQGYVSNLNFIFPNPYECGCMDPNAINYNPDASVSSGDCFYECQDFDVMNAAVQIDACAGDTITLSVTAGLASNPTFEWIGTGIGNSFLEDANSATTRVFIPAGFSGNITYTCTITDEYNCQEFASTLVTVAAAPLVEITGDPFVCGTDSTLLVLQGGPFQSILWSNGATTDTLLVGAGTYSVTVSDGGICDGTDMIVVGAFPTPSVMINGLDTICALDSVLLFVDTSFVSYQWSNGDTLPFTNVQLAQEYTLEVVDSNGCTARDTFSLAHYDVTPLTITGPASFCVDETATLEASTGFVSYLWSTGDTTLSIEVSQSDTIMLMATDSNMCLSEASFIIDTLSLPVPLITGSDSLCPGESTTLSSTIGFVNYLWSTGDTTSSILTDSMGIYQLTVVDSAGCTGMTAFSVLDAPLPMPEIMGDTIFCIGDSTLLSVASGFATYQWSTGDTTAQIFIDQTGIYEVTVTNSAGCVGADTVILTNYVPELIVIDGPAEICAGTATTLTGPPGFTDYLWSTGATTAAISVDSAAVYVLFATDSNGCRVSGSFTLSELSAPSVAISGVTEICVGGNGQLTASPGFVSYLWSDASETESITVTDALVYGVTVTDNFGCTATASQAVSFSIPQFSIEGNDSFCEGSSTTLMPDSTFSSYLWSTTEETAAITVGDAGNYSLTVTNDLGCTATANVQVEVDTLPQPMITGNLSFCEGVTSVLNGGSGYTSYQWSTLPNGGQLLTINNSGFYGLTVTDGNGCVGEDMVEVTTFPSPNPEILGETGFCPGDTTVLTSNDTYALYFWDNGDTGPQTMVATEGFVRLTVIDSNGCVGTTAEIVDEFATIDPEINGELQFCVATTTELTVSPAFETYLWSNNDTTPTTTFNIPGSAGVTVTDSNGCVTSSIADLSLFPEGTLAVVAPAGFCEGESATLSVTGDFVSYIWSNGETTSEVTVLAADTLSVSAMDAFGCTYSSTVGVVVYDLPEPTIEGALSFCDGFPTTLSVNESYSSYTWSTAETTDSISVGSPGPVSLTVVDTNNCVGSTGVTLTIADGLTPGITGDQGLCPDEITTLYVTEEYATYSWSDGSIGDSLIVDAGGTYTVSVTDEAGCTGEISLDVVAFSAPSVSITGDTSFCANLSTVLDAQASSTGMFLWDNGETSSSLEVNAGGEYSLVFTDNNGCQASASATVEMLAVPPVVIVGPTRFCEEDSAELTVPTGFASYLWSTGDTGFSTIVSTPGDVSVTITDDAGCQNEAQSSVVEIELPWAFAGEGQVLDCDTDSVLLGSESTSQGDTISYTWSGPGITMSNQGELSPVVSEPGLYYLQVTDEANGCLSGIDSVEVLLMNEAPALNLAIADTLDCITNTVVLDGSGSATGSAFSYEWLDPSGEVLSAETSLNLEVNTPGTYTLVVTNMLTACVAQGTMPVLEDFNYPAVTIAGGEQLDCAIMEVSLTGTTTSEATTIVQEWTTTGGNIIGDPSSSMIMTNTPGMYFFTVTDITNGCATTDSLEVVEDVVIPDVVTSDVITLFCNDANVTISGQGSSQGNQFTYQWWQANTPLPTATNLNLTVEAPGTYELVVTNVENSCSASASVEILEDPEAPQSFELVFDPPTCAGDTDGSVSISGVSGGLSPYVYSFAGQPFSLNTNFQNLGAGSYQVILEDANGCQLTALAELEDGNDLWVELGDNQTIEAGDQADIIPELSIDSLALQSLSWQTAAELSCPECLNQTRITLFEATQFFLTVTDENGCIAKDEVTIFVKKREGIFVPNIFSPNDDGYNDYFFLQTDGNTIEEINSLQIFERWGSMVWETKNIQPDEPMLGWDGKQSGRPLNPAVFVWFAEIKLKSGEKIIEKGEITLIK
ncbi:gliding motility-associated C-terminal domain-containing protein [Lewinella cohaerens]|uniref:gliding motility-associated C-terminal domain-containing protein n=1 Tax=Lewinella cohaerens TaxID=70995 RepID=UPI00036E9113|nr:gliding motility-associated C-terminal domain-containing protein [Lewinella cohaerens]